jgi:hypothetical protein
MENDMPVMLNNIQELKLESKYFDDVASGLKKFEIRDNTDRDFRVGDLLVMRRWEDGHYAHADEHVMYYGDPSEPVTHTVEVSKSKADALLVRVTYITDFEQKDGFVVLGIEPFKGDA